MLEQYHKILNKIFDKMLSENYSSCVVEARKSFSSNQCLSVYDDSNIFYTQQECGNKTHIQDNQLLTAFTGLYINLQKNDGNFRKWTKSATKLLWFFLEIQILPVYLQNYKYIPMDCIWRYILYMSDLKNVNTSLLLKFSYSKTITYIVKNSLTDPQPIWEYWPHISIITKTNIKYINMSSLTTLQHQLLQDETDFNIPAQKLTLHWQTLSPAPCNMS